MGKYSKSWRDLKPSKSSRIINRLLKGSRQTSIKDFLGPQQDDHKFKFNKV